jgi:hypothetical protein
MTSVLPLTQLVFGSLLSYSPKPDTEIAKQSKTAMNNLKNDVHLPRFNLTMTEYVAELVNNNKTTLPFTSIFEDDPILVPVPKSSLMRSDDLWVPQRLAIELSKRGCGGDIVECLFRRVPLRKSATSDPKDRPTAPQHFNSIGIQTNLISNPTEILLVDDIITRGATTLGAANRLYMAFPNAKIRVFAAIRTVSYPDKFENIYDARFGTIKGEIKHIDDHDTI